ncbi:MAG: nucleoside deaminase [Bacilli bacterium]|nr:nucleoside deaminase [Bacilli bacterium]
MDKYFEEAVNLAKVGVENNEGGPFGAVVVKNGEVVGRGNNKVLINNDPTAHAEVVAIRDACRNLNTYDLTDCIIYSTSEPCPMCLSSIIWSNIKTVYFSSDRKEVSSIGFRDDLIYKYFEENKKDILNATKCENIKCNNLLKEYKNTIY